jgi:phosphatidylcholine synthase
MGRGSADRKSCAQGVPVGSGRLQSRSFRSIGRQTEREWRVIRRIFNYRKVPYAEIRAFSVHLLTASGSFLAFLGVVAAAESRFVDMFWWLGLALFVDGIDGPIARKVRVREVLPNWSGDTLDNIIDYVTYVLLPAFALYKSGMIGEPWSFVAAGLIVVSSAIYYADTGMKTDEYFFSGFPVVWNMVIFTLFVIQASETTAFIVVIVSVILTFLPINFLQPARSMPCSARTAPASRPWSRCIFGCSEPTKGEISFDGPAGRDRLAQGGAQARHRHGLPAFFAVRRLTVPRTSRSPRRDRRRRQELKAKDARRCLQLRLPLDPDSRGATLSVGERQRIEIVRCLLQKPEAADHPRRADLGADAAGGRQAVRDARAAARRGQIDPLHLASARRGEAHVRPRHRAAPRQGGRPLRPAQGDGGSRWRA